jgi:hypothetical protein
MSFDLFINSIMHSNKTSIWKLFFVKICLLNSMNPLDECNENICLRYNLNNGLIKNSKRLKEI